jgi:hypothetical protein
VQVKQEKLSFGAQTIERRLAELTGGRSLAYNVFSSPVSELLGLADLF